MAKRDRIGVVEQFIFEVLKNPRNLSVGLSHRDNISILTEVAEVFWKQLLLSPMIVSLFVVEKLKSGPLHFMLHLGKPFSGASCFGG